MNVRKAKMADMREIQRIYGCAREYMKRSGNPTQWKDNYPPEELTKEDIRLEQCYVIEGKGGGLCGVFVFFMGEEPDYAVIEQGKWLNNADYGVIHRIAGDGSEKGVFAEAFAFCREKTANIRIDTHRDNLTMQSVLNKNGFKRCGIIYLRRGGEERLAYHWTRGETFILNGNHDAVQYLCRRDKRLEKVVSLVGDITCQSVEDSYTFLVHEIIEQMLSVKAGRAIYGRLEKLCGGMTTPEAVNALTDEEIKSIGTSDRKVEYIRHLTSAIKSGTLKFDELTDLPDKEVMKRLTFVRGIGNWTAKMYLIFVLNRPDVLPYEDAAFLQGYGWTYKTNDFTPASVMKKCRKWKPYSSIAARYMYRALDMGLTKGEFPL